MIGSLRVPRGNYTLYTLPAAPLSSGSEGNASPGTGEPWMLILNKQTGQWGTLYDASRDLGRVPMHGATLSSPQQLMTISFTKDANGFIQMHIRWEATDESVIISPAT